MNNYSSSFTVDQSPEEVFAAINNVRGWWSGEIEGNTGKLGDEFSYRQKDIHYSKQKVAEWIPAEKIVWLVTDAQLNFTADKAEWKGTEIIFELKPKANKTEVRFTHKGLVPEIECFEACSNAWGYYLGALRNFITTGLVQE